MADDRLEEFKDDFGLLIEAGFVAVKQQDEPSAVKLFHAAEVLDPESPAPHVGLGYIALNKLELKEAEKIFSKVLEENPEHHLARTFLGIAHLLSEDKRKEGRQMIEKAMKESDDPTVINLGEVSLEWALKDLKKSKAPFFEKGD